MKKVCLGQGYGIVHLRMRVCPLEKKVLIVSSVGAVSVDDSFPLMPMESAEEGGSLIFSSLP
jgi:hypothetical protein